MDERRKRIHQSTQRRLTNMRLIRYDYPASTDFDRILGALFPAAGRCGDACGTTESATWTSSPKVNLSETTELYEAKVELPGVKKEDIKVEFENSILSVSAKRPVKTAEGESTEEFSRSFTIPAGVDAGKVQAAYENGVLTLTLPKTPEAKLRNIEVR